MRVFCVPFILRADLALSLVSTIVIIGRSQMSSSRNIFLTVVLFPQFFFLVRTQVACPMSIKKLFSLFLKWRAARETYGGRRRRFNCYSWHAAAATNTIWSLDETTPSFFLDSIFACLHLSRPPASCDGNVTSPCIGFSHDDMDESLSLHRSNQYWCRGGKKKKRRKRWLVVASFPISLLLLLHGMQSSNLGQSHVRRSGVNRTRME